MKRFVFSAVFSAMGLVAVAGPGPTPATGPRGDTWLASGAKISATPEVERPADCPADMVEVEGEYCPVVEQICIKMVDPKHPDRDRCEEFAPSGRCYGVPEHKSVCIDRYEWPNRPGAKPDIGMDWLHAGASCKAAGKRLCTDSEWTLACEGAERLPYPYGYVRNREACNIDRTYIMPDEAKWANPKTRPEEAARLDQRDPSGARESCVSPYGVYDMTGNVDEWVVNEHGTEKEKPYVSGLKGGYWGPVRDRCRPMTTDHNVWHTGYQIGFRCCEDVGAQTPRAPETASSPASPSGA